MDAHAEKVGLHRKAANKASGAIEVAAIVGTVIPRAFRVTTAATAEKPGEVFETLLECTIGSEGGTYDAGAVRKSSAFYWDNTTSTPVQMILCTAPVLAGKTNSHEPSWVYEQSGESIWIDSTNKKYSLIGNTIFKSINVHSLTGDEYFKAGNIILTT